jgi:hypothetical protein
MTTPTKSAVKIYACWPRSYNAINQCVFTNGEKYQFVVTEDAISIDTTGEDVKCAALDLRLELNGSPRRHEQSSWAESIEVNDLFKRNFIALVGMFRINPLGYTAIHASHNQSYSLLRFNTTHYYSSDEIASGSRHIDIEWWLDALEQPVAEFQTTQLIVSGQIDSEELLLRAMSHTKEFNDPSPVFHSSLGKAGRLGKTGNWPKTFVLLEQEKHA